ncbi:MAG: hypothetical protein ACE5G0_16725 [Rhodothermales bacterium]
MATKAEADPDMESRTVVEGVVVKRIVVERIVVIGAIRRIVKAREIASIAIGPIVVIRAVVVIVIIIVFVVIARDDDTIPILLDFHVVRLLVVIPIRTGKLCITSR